MFVFDIMHHLNFYLFPSALRQGHNLLQLTSNIRKLALLQLGLPENRIRIIESMLDPPVFLDVVQVDEATRVGVAMGCGEDASAAEFEGFVVFEVVFVVGVQHAVGECLARAHAEEVACEARAVAVDVVEGGAFLGGYAGAHCSL